MADNAPIVIAGAGMVGLTLACALAEDGFAVTVIEARAPAPPEQWPAFDLRVSAITRASQRIFTNLDVWDAMADLRITPYRDMRVWDAGGWGEIHFDSAELGEPGLGHIVENRVVVQALWARAGQLGVTLRCPAKVTGFTMTEHGGSVRLDDGSELTAALLVAADGASSGLRALAAIPVQAASYEQQAVVATVQVGTAHQDTAWQRFLPAGPLALLPLGPEHVSIVWTTSPTRAEVLLGMDDAQFDAALTVDSEGRLGNLTLAGPRAAFPLQRQHAERYVQAGFALVGDAAHQIHPLAGQGVNLGLLDAAALAEVLVAARAARRPPGALATLRRYERARRGDNLAMQQAMTAFKELFGDVPAPLRLMRNLGLSLADRAGPLKRRLARAATGTLLGDLPPLARRRRPRHAADPLP